MSSDPTSDIIHATSVAVEGKGALILGPSGSGKSSLALNLIALGAHLISDDRTQLARAGDALIASAPPAIAGLIEARGIGLIRTVPAGQTPVALVVDLSRTEHERLPHPHTHSLLAVTVPCLWGISGAHFAAAILLYLKGGIGA